MFYMEFYISCPKLLLLTKRWSIIPDQNFVLLRAPSPYTTHISSMCGQSTFQSKPLPLTVINAKLRLNISKVSYVTLMDMIQIKRKLIRT